VVRKKHVEITIKRELPSKLGQVVTLLTCILEGSGSNLDWDYTDYCFLWFSFLVPSHKCRHRSPTGPRVIPSKSFLIRLSFVIPPSDATCSAALIEVTFLQNSGCGVTILSKNFRGLPLSLVTASFRTFSNLSFINYHNIRRHTVWTTNIAAKSIISKWIRGNHNHKFWLN
jgi:hypothetical protein